MKAKEMRELLKLAEEQAFKDLAATPADPDQLLGANGDGCPVSEPKQIKPNLLQKVLELAVMGRTVLPVGLNKRPFLDEWKGLQSTPPSTEQITDWSAEFKPPAWAVISGVVSGVVVIDFDGDQGKEWLQKFGLLPHVRSGSGGFHVHLKHPGTPVKTMNAKTAKNNWPYPGIDVRGDGGYAVTVGRNSHGSYEQLRSFDDLDPFELLPEELRRLVLKSENKPQSDAVRGTGTDGNLEDRLIAGALDMVRSGQGRNDSGFWLSCQLRDNGVSQSGAKGVMRRFASACPATNTKGQHEPYSEAEIQASLNQAFSTAPREPWKKAKPTKAQYFQDSVQDTLHAAERELLPVIRVSNRQLRDISSESLEALNKANTPPFLFARNGSMVAVICNEHGRQVISDVSESALRGRLSRAANFLKYSLKGHPTGVPPPIEVVRDILSLEPAQWGFLPLDGVVEAPVLRPDGSILGTPGYDSTTRLYYSPDPDLRIPEIPDRPTADHVDVAIAMILDVIGGFPFVDQASRANAIASMLTSICRPAIKGPTPLALFDATTAGTGKTLLSEVVSLIVSGREGALFSAPREPDEWRKQLTSVLREGSPIVTIDNVKYRLDSADLCKALTETTHGDRILGQSLTINLPVRCTWIATGNNIQLGGDMARRCYWVRMDAKCPKPFQRTGFKHKRLKEYVLKHRGELLAALLTLARAWFVAGCPEPSLTPVGSYEDWSVIIGGILQYAGIEGFLANSDQLHEQADIETVQWEAFLMTLDSVFYSEPFAVAQVWDRMSDKTYNADTHQSLLTKHAEELRTALPDFIAKAMNQEGFFKQRLGFAFSERVGRRYGETQSRIERDADDLHGKVARWKVVKND